MMVHVVGALAIRLSETDQPAAQSEHHTLVAHRSTVEWPLVAASLQVREVSDEAVIADYGGQ